MSYVKQTWADNEEGGTPISAARLNYIENGVEASAQTTTGVSQLLRRHTYQISGRPHVDFMGWAGESHANYPQAMRDLIAEIGSTYPIFLPPGSYPWASGVDIDQSNISIKMASGASLEVPSGYNSYVWRIKNPTAAVTVSRVDISGGKAIELGVEASRLNLWDYIRLHATNKGISWCRIRDTRVWYPGRMIVLKNDAAAAGFINGNAFTDLEALNPRTAIVQFEDDVVSGGANRNHFTRVDGQAAAFTTGGYLGIGRRANFFNDCKAFDLNQNPAAVSATIAATGVGTIINGGAMTQQNFVDAGTNTKINDEFTGSRFSGGVIVPAGDIDLDNARFLRWKDALGAYQSIMRVTTADNTEITAPSKILIKSVGQLEFFTAAVRRAFFTAAGHLTIEDAVNIILNTTTGTKIGTATTQKLGFFNKAPVTQRAAIASPAADVAELKTAVDALRQAFIDLGLTA